MIGVLKAMQVTIRHLFTRAFTSEYPTEKRELPPRFRGALAIRGFVSEAYEAPYTSHIAPCTQGCPAFVDARGYINLVAQKKYLEAYLLHLESNPLPATFGRICYHPCEVTCRRTIEDEPLSIRVIKRYFADEVFPMIESGKIAEMLKPKDKRPEKVAVIGSGPSGLSCAFYLARAGYQVTIFEKLPVAGGMMAVGIPEYRLPRNILQAEVNMIVGLGVELKLNQEMGVDFSLDGLFDQGYQAVFLGIGAATSFEMGIPGEDLKGVIPGEDFLKKVALGEKFEVGSKAAVIGAGNTAIDCARTAKRLGADVSIVYRRGREEMPAHRFEVDAAEAEGVKLELLKAPEAFIGENGKLKAARMVNMQLGAPDSTGRRRPVPIKGSQHEVPLDSAFSAIGRLPTYCRPNREVDEEFASYGVNIADRKRTIIIEDSSGGTSRTGVFAGGDVVSGPTTAIQAIYGGHRGAAAIDVYLKTGEMPREGPRPSAYVPMKSRFSWRLREPIPEIDPKARIQDFSEVELPYSESQVIEESERCLSCKSGNCIGCKLCAKACPDRCFYIEANENGERKIERFDIDLSTCCYCGLCSEACPTHCLLHTRVFEYGTYGRAGLLFPKERLFKLGKGL